MDAQRSDDDEPTPSGEEWVEFGTELIWAMGFTAGGAPYGLTAEQFRQSNAQHEYQAGWARAKNQLSWAFEACSPPEATVAIGWVRKIGTGLWREAYAADVELVPDPNRLSGAWAVLLPGDQATPEAYRRWVAEVKVLGQLARLPLPFRVPAVLGVFPEGERPVVIRQFMEGVPLDLRAGRMQSIKPAKLVGQLAATIHAIDVSAWPGYPPGTTTRRAHGEEQLSVFDDLDDEVEPARQWASDHLPADREATLLHGDLLGQNILVIPEEKPALIDWEFCRMGDPAHDLAIVTRGVRRPFQMARGLDRLLDAYAAAGGEPLTAAEVHFREVCLAARWYHEALPGTGREPPEQARARLTSILRRAEAASS